MAEHARQVRKSAEPAAARAEKAEAGSTPHSELLNRRSDALLGPAIQLLDRRAAITAAAAPQPIQPKARPNRTGLPDRLKAGVEALSGLSMDDVRVHRNSAAPAKLGALAYAQGSQIHLGPGQEQHLPHETWHVVQQKQARVRATVWTDGLPTNNSPALEAEAESMGSRALGYLGSPLKHSDASGGPNGARAKSVEPLTASGGSSRAMFQLYTPNADGSKTSENGRYITEGSGYVDALPGSTVDMSQIQGISRRSGYVRWVPRFDLIGDCVAAMEEVMHGQKLKYGVPDASEYRDLSPAKPFGESDAKNRKRGRDSDRGHKADPARGEAYLITRQGHARDQVRPQFHGATVVAQDGPDNITLEATAPPSGGISATRIPGVYDMYGTAKRLKQTFKTAYRAEYGKDATVSVLKAAKALPQDAVAPSRSRKVIDF